MPIPEAPAAAGPYNTDGVTTTFAFAYKSFGVGYHAVVKETSGVQVQLVYGVDFAVTQNADQEANPGGNVIISPALPAGSTLTIYSNVPYDQPFDPSTAGGAFRSAAVRDAIDRVVTLLKQSDLATGGGTLLPSDRSLRVPSGESINALPVAASRASKILLFDGSGNASVATLGDLALLLAGGSMSGDINMSGNDITNVASLEVDGAATAQTATVVDYLNVSSNITWKAVQIIGAGNANLPFKTSVGLGGGLVLATGSDTGGNSWARIYLLAIRQFGGAGALVTAVLVSTAGPGTPPTIAFSDAGGFVNAAVSGASANQSYFCGFGGLSNS